MLSASFVVSTLEESSRSQQKIDGTELAHDQSALLTETVDVLEAVPNEVEAVGESRTKPIAVTLAVSFSPFAAIMY